MCKIWKLQIIRKFEIDAERYVAENFHRRVTPPGLCPHCGEGGSLWSLGYYARNLTRLGVGILCIFIRRFRCNRCRKTVSILPSFAQPYRLVQNGTIEKFASGIYEVEVLRWFALLRRYWLRFVGWLPEMQRVIWKDQSRPPPECLPGEWWEFLVSEHGSFSAATMATVAVFQITFFGRYRCHQPRPPHDSMGRETGRCLGRWRDRGLDGRGLRGPDREDWQQQADR